MSANGCVCGSINCKRYDICKRAICEEENKQYYETNWHDYGSVNYTNNGIEERYYCGKHGNYAMFIPLDHLTTEDVVKHDSDVIYVKEDRLDIYYNSGELEDGTVFDKPYLMVSRFRQDMTVINRFYGDEAAELYKKLTEYGQ